jgi:hypothetical protein
MPEILNLGLSDEEYLQQIAEGRDPVQEYICEQNLIRAGVPQKPLMKLHPFSRSQTTLVMKRL